MNVLAKRYKLPLFLTGVVLLAQAFRYSGVVRDAAAERVVPGYEFHLPLSHLIFTPFFVLADLLTCMSLRQHMVFLVWLAAGYLLWRIWVLIHREESEVSPLRAGLEREMNSFAGTILAEAGKAFLALLLWVSFLAGMTLLPRSMAALRAPYPDVCLVDFHSHSSISHDGRKSFTAWRNIRWHRDAGFNAGFITDHNQTAGAHLAKRTTLDLFTPGAYVSLEGEELSLFKQHMVALGLKQRIDNRPFDSFYERLPLAIRAVHAMGGLAVMSIPEYWLYHWNDLDDFDRWGVDGYEIVNSAPKGLDFPPSLRRRIVERCRAKNLFMTAATDNHGWARAVYAWSAVWLPGWRDMKPDQRERAILERLKEKGFGAVQVLTRIKPEPEGWGSLALDPFWQAVCALRSLSRVQAAALLAWIWAFFALTGRRRKSQMGTALERRHSVVRMGGPVSGRIVLDRRKWG